MSVSIYPRSYDPPPEDWNDPPAAQPPAGADGPEKPHDDLGTPEIAAPIGIRPRTGAVPASGAGLTAGASNGGGLSGAHPATHGEGGRSSLLESALHAVLDLASGLLPHDDSSGGDTRGSGGGVSNGGGLGH
jgi:hypothetical protein